MSNLWSILGPAVANMLLVLALAPLLEGLVRKLRAIIQSRQGPPVTQPYLDLLKLLVKEDLRVTASPVVTWGPPLFLAAILVAAGVMPLGGRVPEAAVADAVVFIGLLALANITLAGLGFATGSAFSALGASREVMLMLAAEPVLFISLLVLALGSGSLTFGGMLTGSLGVAGAVAALTYLLGLQMLVAKVPFDITEAETELMGGPLSELSGPRLAMTYWGIYAKQFIYASLFVQLFIPWVRSIPWTPVAVLANVALVLVVSLLVVGIVASVNPRLRLDQALRYGLTLASVAALALIYAAIV